MEINQLFVYTVCSSIGMTVITIAMFLIKELFFDNNDKDTQDKKND